MLTEDFKSKFLLDSEHTGRHFIKSIRTGKVYAVEAIDGERIKWGDLNPATGKVEGNYGEKYKGSIAKDESLITEENGFINIEDFPKGISPYAQIEVLDARHPTLSHNEQTTLL